MSVSLPEKEEKRVAELIGHYPEKRAAIGDVLYIAQQHFGHLGPEVEFYVAGMLDLPVTYVHQVVTFYNMYLQQPVGENLIMLCDNVSCTLCGAAGLVEHVRNKLGIAPGETTEDNKFTFWTVECLGACELAPCLLIGEKLFGRMTPEKLDEAIDAVE
ncbi:MAG: NAD(P)H-dependent oxidoreductase subunit E [Candidatus Glassbacteria bacterium]|nr:NAD(P)H-dependent oxidoreductase subunit E [Candidatus Glassbacteria bacterium]